MDATTKTTIVQMLKSGEKEMCNLAMTIFIGLTRNYSHYYDIRTMYDSNHMFVENEHARAAFNTMFNNLDENTIQRRGKKNLKDYRRTSLSSKQKRRARKQSHKF